MCNVRIQPQEAVPHLDVVVRVRVRRLLRQRAGLAVRETRLLLEDVLDDVFVLGHEDLAFPERHYGQREEDHPHDAHDDDHDHVPDVESFDLKGISEQADCGNPANCKQDRESVHRISNPRIYNPTHR